MESAYNHPSIITDYLVEEQRHDQIVCRLVAHWALPLHYSSLGVIPKCSQPKKWWHILDLSRHSVNDGINRDLCSLSYMSTDDIGSVVLQFGQGARIEKHTL